jgi:hypothetical protein
MNKSHRKARKVDMTKKKYQVFISSTYTDLKEERMAVTMCLLRNGFIPVGMEQFPASGMEQMEYIKMMLDDCDYYILILAGRYGSIDNSDGVGYTEKEYDYAISKGIPVLSFVLRDLNTLPQAKHEKTKKGQKKLESFRARVLNSQLAQMYDNSADLREGVVTAIHQIVNTHPQNGWVRCGNSNEVDETEKDDKKEKVTEAQPLTNSEFALLIKDYLSIGESKEREGNYGTAYLAYLTAYNHDEKNMDVSFFLGRVLGKMTDTERRIVLKSNPLPTPLMKEYLHIQRGKAFVSDFLKTN